MNEIIPPPPKLERSKNTVILEIEQLMDTGTIELKEETKYIAFYADIPHKEVNEVIKDIEEYYDDTKSYLIGLEYAEAREHYHFVINFTEKEYAAYVKRVLKGKFHLSGRRNKKGHTGQFGKVSKIRNIDAMCSYTLKDLDYRTNFRQEKIDRLVKASYPKPESDTKEFMEECMMFIKEEITIDDTICISANNYNDSPVEIAQLVIKFLKSKKRDLLASTVKRFTMRYITYHSQNYDTYALFKLLFPHGI